MGKKRGVKAKGIRVSQPTSTSKIKLSPPSHQTKVNFSFKYFDNGHSKFSTLEKEYEYFHKVLDKMKILSDKEMSHLVASGARAYRFHPIIWKDVTENGFPDHVPPDIAGNPYQFNITQSKYGRVHGFIIGSTFFVVWLDPEHNLYPDKRNTYFGV